MKTERILARWGLIMIGDRGPIFAGEDPAGAGWRTSTPLVAFDAEEGTGITASGRPYRLVGPPDPAYALQALNALWNTEGADIRIISPEEAVPFVEANRPFDRTPEEQAAVAAWRLPKVAAQIRLMMVLQGREVGDVADLVGVAPDRLRALLDGQAEGWTVAEADEVFDTMAAAGRRMGME